MRQYPQCLFMDIKVQFDQIQLSVVACNCIATMDRHYTTEVRDALYIYISETNTTFTVPSTLAITEDHGGETVSHVNTIIALFIGIFGILDNGLVLIVILSSKSMRGTITNILIINQAIIDLVTCFFLAVNPPTVDYSVPYSGALGEVYCRVWLSNYLWQGPCVASTCSLILITIERYSAIVDVRVTYITKLAILGDREPSGYSQLQPSVLFLSLGAT